VYENTDLSGRKASCTRASTPNEIVQRTSNSVGTSYK